MNIPLRLSRTQIVSQYLIRAPYVSLQSLSRRMSIIMVVCAPQRLGICHLDIGQSRCKEIITWLLDRSSLTHIDGPHPSPRADVEDPLEIPLDRSEV